MSELETLKTMFENRPDVVDLLNKVSYEIEHLKEVVNIDCDILNNKEKEINDLKIKIEDGIKKQEKAIKDIDNLGSYKLLSTKYVSKEKVLSILKGSDKE